MLVKKVSSLDEPITSAKFKLEKFYKYIRIIVTDTNGKKAYTNAYEL